MGLWIMHFSMTVEEGNRCGYRIRNQLLRLIRAFRASNIRCGSLLRGALASLHLVVLLVVVIILRIAQYENTKNTFNII